MNLKATEILYETIAELANLNTNTILLDICCGVGTIGIYLAKQKVSAIEYYAFSFAFNLKVST